ncbi:MAG: hypothetical protein KTR20_02555 [Cellvibrionaceae bacterium]|nr:hypothetical protein [Cellvibrionaceae bacterium]
MAVFIAALGVYSYREWVAFADAVAPANAHEKSSGLMRKLMARRDDLTSQLTVLMDDLDEKQAIKSLYSEGVIKKFSGIDAMLTLIASNHTDDFFVSDVVIARQGSEVLLKGVARDAASVVDYIESLRRAEAFQQLSFGLLSIEKSDDEKWLHFSMLNNRRVGVHHAVE